MGATSVQPDENLRFLYICLKNANGKDQIDWPAVATIMNLNAPAARMRFRRLENKIVKGMGSKSAETGENQDSSPPVESETAPSPTKKRRVTKSKKAAETNNGKGKKEVDESAGHDSD